MISFLFTASLALGLGAAAPQASTISLPPPLCTSKSSPNPIAAQYPNNATGTLNGTIIVAPIPLSLARSIVPKEYPILTAAYQKLLPTFPKDQYPMFLEGVLDHDIRSEGVNSVPDFTRTNLVFPFVDRLNDNSTCFRTALPLQVSANPIAIAGANAYSPGDVYPGTFDPPCEGYSFVPGASVNGKPVRRQRSWTGTNQALGKPPSYDVSFVDVLSQPWPMSFLGNITNQPLFGRAPLICDNFIEYFNTSISRGSNAPVPIQATIKVQPPFFPTSRTFQKVYGIRVDRAFLENNFVPCTSLKGYSGPGAAAYS